MVITFFYYLLSLTEIQQLIVFFSLKMAGSLSSYVNKSVEFVASTQSGQYFIKKLDTVLWAIEKPAKYCVDGESNGDRQKLPWPVFWTVFIYLQIFRVVLSKLVKNPIQPMDIVKILQKWRRTLRSIRFRGLRKIREYRLGTAKSNENGGKLLRIIHGLLGHRTI